MKNQSCSTYTLLDTSLMAEVGNAPWMRDRRCRGWIERIHDRRAAAVSPVLLDIDAAYRSGRMPLMMEFVAACNPKFHVSLIDSELSLTDLANHLRELIYFMSDDGEEFTLRFADGAVLMALSTVLSESQWKSFNGPIERWRVHDRENKLMTLAYPLSDKTDLLPLKLTLCQMSQLKEQLAVFQILANLQMNISKINQFRLSKKI